MFAGDDMIIDVDLPSRLDESGDLWGWSSEMVLRHGSVSLKKNIEWNWGKEQILIGFHGGVRRDERNPPTGRQC